MRIKNPHLIVILLLWSQSTTIAEPSAKRDPRRFYVAPHSVGEGSGDSEVSAAYFRTSEIWSKVHQTIQERPVTVSFLDGIYTISSDAPQAMPPLALSKLGHKEHQLVLEGISKEGVVFTRLSTDPSDGDTGPGFLELTDSENVVVRNLHFTGSQPIGCPTYFGGSKNVLIERCSWIDLPGVKFGATATSFSADHVTYSDCVFKRVGTGTSTHMSYNSDGAKHIAFINCLFEDCTGDYVRFRSGADFGIVAGCTFKSTGKKPGTNVPFISVSVFNNDDPNKPSETASYEYLGTHFLITNNTFDYPRESTTGARIAIVFHHSGFDPPGRRYLLTSQEAEILAKAPINERRALLFHNCGLSAEHIHMFDNRFSSVEVEVGYRSQPLYGAKSKGWGGVVDITETVNKSTFVDAEGALKFFD